MYLIGSGLGAVTESCEYGSEISGSIKAREFRDQLSDYKLVREVSVPCSFR